MHSDPRTCQHEKTELRCRPDKNGHKRYQRQCLTCGQPHGSWVARQDAARETGLDTIPPFREDIKDSAWERAAAIDEARVDAALEKMRPAYEAYLVSPAWRAKREHVLNRANGICEGCGINKATQVHHFSYHNLGREFLWDLAAVCEDCHSRSHPWKDSDRSSRARMLRQQLFQQVENSPLFQEKIREILKD